MARPPSAHTTIEACASAFPCPTPASQNAAQGPSRNQPPLRIPAPPSLSPPQPGGLGLWPYLRTRALLRPSAPFELAPPPVPAFPCRCGRRLYRPSFRRRERNRRLRQRRRCRLRRLCASRSLSTAYRPCAGTSPLPRTSRLPRRQPVEMVPLKKREGGGSSSVNPKICARQIQRRSGTISSLMRADANESTGNPRGEAPPHFDVIGRGASQDAERARTSPNTSPESAQVE